MAYATLYFTLSYIQHNLRGLDANEKLKRLTSFASFFQRYAKAFADRLLRIINEDPLDTLPTLDYVIIVGQSLDKPNHVIVIVYNEKHGDDSDQPVARIEHWKSGETVLSQSGKYEVFVIE